MIRKEQKANSKTCFFCKEKREPDFLDYEILSRFVSERGRILPRVRSGICSKHQRKLMVAVKRARHLALLPFVVKAE
ncbi:MAG: 30S ribosomal protein S18 [Candidatus Levybacteria bacterium RIFCSPHIGHO2_01_FULL_36_15]|nr:MAG: 30S ribosomal protein S18 [Candidatus Levybacteria bacterium RIFCSPHIGHO2_01_FULL_36_15]OGH38044.1 MAG: 30S ribosomal protein S18 [Candidatus Levybacteria bacterium RIFCSPLOWO2_01_FULL_36_10]